MHANIAQLEKPLKYLNVEDGKPAKVRRLRKSEASKHQPITLMTNTKSQLEVKLKLGLRKHLTITLPMKNFSR